MSAHANRNAGRINQRIIHWLSADGEEKEEWQEFGNGGESRG